MTTSSWTAYSEISYPNTQAPGGLTGTSVGLTLQHLPFLPQQMFALQLADSSGTYGSTVGFVRVEVADVDGVAGVVAIFVMTRSETS